MTPEEVLEMFWNEPLIFHYYYKGKFEFMGTNSDYILRGFIKINSMEYDEFEIFPDEPIYVKEFKERFTHFEVWKYKPSKLGKIPKAYLVYRSSP